MPITIDGKEIESVYYNGTAMDYVYLDGVLVFENWSEHKGSILASGYYSPDGATSFQWRYATPKGLDYGIQPKSIHISGRFTNRDTYAQSGYYSQVEGYNMTTKKWETLSKKQYSCPAGTQDSSGAVTSYGVRDFDEWISLDSNTMYSNVRYSIYCKADQCSVSGYVYQWAQKG